LAPARDGKRFQERALLILLVVVLGDLRELMRRDMMTALTTTTHSDLPRVDVSLETAFAADRTRTDLDFG